MSYKMHYVTQNSWKGGKMEFSENEAISAFTSENVVTLSDGLVSFEVEDQHRVQKFLAEES